MGNFESSFPWAVSPIIPKNDENEKGKTSNDVNITKNRKFDTGSTDNLEEDLEIFKKYLYIAIKKELKENNITIEYGDNQNDLRNVVNQAKHSSAIFKANFEEQIRKENESKLEEIS